MFYKKLSLSGLVLISEGVFCLLQGAVLGQNKKYRKLPCDILLYSIDLDCLLLVTLIHQ